MITVRRSTTTPSVVIEEGGDTIRITSREEAARVMLRLAIVLDEAFPERGRLPEQRIVFGCPGDGA